MQKERRRKENERLQAALDDALPEVFACAREAMKRTLGMRHFDVQLMGGVVLHQGKIAEMKTGEGKTFVPTLAAALNGLTGRGVHLVTVNDYLARRDAQWMGPVYHFLGLSVGIIVHDTAYVFEPGYPTTDERLINLRPVARREAYAADITYGTNNEFGFDYLRDNMVTELDERVQRERFFAIVDEVDNILIDEARTPLIISGQAEESARPLLHVRPAGAQAAGAARGRRGGRRLLRRPQGQGRLPDRGWASRRWSASSASPNLYDADPRLARHFEQALRAHALYRRDKDYLVKDGEIVIVDEFTGRQMPGRRWSEGLHQAIEAKEGLRVQRESVTLATITFQNYFRLYDKLAGMTGTAMTEGEEFHKIYKLEVVAIPTNQPMIREDDAGPRLPERERQVQRAHRRDRGDDRRGTAGPRGHGHRREVRDPRRAPAAARGQARGPQRQVPREGGRDRRPGRTLGRRHDRDQHGRPRHGHPPRRQPGRPRLGDAPPARPQPGRGGPRDVRRGLPRGEGPLRRRARGRCRGGRPAHHRHRAPREPTDRQPAPRPRRPPGRPRLVALLPVPRGRPHEALRLRSRGGPDGAPRPRGRRRDRIATRQQDHRERPEPRRGLQLRHPQARRRVRRRHQQAARDDLRRARQGPPQRGPDRYRPGLPRRGGRGPARPVLLGASTPTTGVSRAWRRASG